MQDKWRVSFSGLISNTENYPTFVALEGNRTSYQYQGGGCEMNTNTTAGSELSLTFYYVDRAHPFKVCGNGTTWPSYQINVAIYLTPIGYDLSRSVFTSVYYSPTNTTVLCITSATHT